MGSLRQLPYLLFLAVIIIKPEIHNIILKYQNKKMKQHLYLPNFQNTELHNNNNKLLKT